ncbi:MAG: division/cell wall cluster transcriptional repressor MraZ [Saprospiraceae bacterium]|nr:division/cell wall cluster transcriptional repressor MraZ [Saprospiraceae bacterium]
MYRLSGEFECKIDAKGRLKLPANLLRQLGEGASQSFTLNRGFEKCVMLYPKSTWDMYTAQLQKLNPFVTKNREFIRAFYRGATPVTTDTSDRILIPRNLIEHAGCKKEVIVNAYAGFIEIWDKARYVKTVRKSSSDDLAEMAETVFGNIPELDWGA